MKQGKYVSAYNTIGKLSNQEIPLSTGLKLFNLKKQLEPQFEFQTESEEKIFNQYPVLGATIAKNGKTILSFEDDNAAAEAKTLLNELENMEIDLDIIPITISEADGLIFTLNDIDALSPFVNFITEENGETEPAE